MEPEEKLGKLKSFLYGTLIGNVVTLVIVLGFIYVLIFLVQGSGYSVSEGEVAEEYGYSDESCSVSGINLRGTILTYIPAHAEGDAYFDYDVTASEDVIWYIEDANLNENIKAIVIDVDSPGGLPVAGEEINDAVKNSAKPVVGLIRGVGASSAYWAISSADKIFASENSDVGSIGVTMSYLNNAQKNKNEGYTFENLSIGKYKDSGTPDKSLSEEEKKLFLRDLNIIYENFVKEVAANRKLSVEAVKSFADGSTVLGAKAKELGLIDEIGGIGEVEKYLEETLGEKPEICWY